MIVTAAVTISAIGAMPGPGPVKPIFVDNAARPWSIRLWNNVEFFFLSF
jgi:hypothetical protein